MLGTFSKRLSAILDGLKNFFSQVSCLPIFLFAFLHFSIKLFPDQWFEISSHLILIHIVRYILQNLDRWVKKVAFGKYFQHKMANFRPLQIIRFVQPLRILYFSLLDPLASSHLFYLPTFTKAIITVKFFHIFQSDLPNFSKLFWHCHLDLFFN